MPLPTGCHPVGPRCQTSILAFDPPVPTTESTWVALPTCGANHGVSAWPTGAEATATAAALRAAASENVNRRMGFIVAVQFDGGQVKVGARLGVQAATGVAELRHDPLDPLPGLAVDLRGRIAAES